MAGALVAGLAASVWTGLVLTGWTESWDRALMARAGDWRASAPWLVDAAWFASRAGDGATRILIAIIAGAGLWWAGSNQTVPRKQEHRAHEQDITALGFRFRGSTGAVWLIAVVTGGMALSSLLKRLIARPRPDLIDRLDAISNASYPSGHAMGAAVLSLGLVLLVPRRPVLALATLYVAAVTASRLLLGVHWPSDLVGGLLIGLYWTLAAWSLLIARFGR